MKIKKGDKVIIIAGKDRGKTSTVVRVYPKKEKVVVDGVNMLKKHQRASASGGKGQIVEKAAPVHVSNVMIADPQSGKRTRIAIKSVNGVRTRVARKSGAQIS